MKQSQRLRRSSQLCKLWRAFFISDVVMKITLFDVTSRMYITVILFYKIYLVQVATLLHRTMPAVLIQVKEMNAIEL